MDQFSSKWMLHRQRVIQPIRTTQRLTDGKTWQEPMESCFPRRLGQSLRPTDTLHSLEETGKALIVGEGLINGEEQPGPYPMMHYQLSYQLSCG